MYQKDIHVMAEKLMKESLIDDFLKDNFLAILPFLSEEKIKSMIYKLEKAKLLQENLQSE